MNKNLIKYILIFVAIIIISTIIILIYSFSNKTQGFVSTQEKVKQEINYLDNKIISAINELNNLNTEYLLTNNEITLSQNDNKENNSSSLKQDNYDNNSGEKNQSENNQLQSNGIENSQTNVNITKINPKSILTRNRDEIDWQYINMILEEVNNAWSVITIDLKSINVSNEDLLAFSNNMDESLKYVNEKNRTNALISIANVYNMIPNYQNSYSNESEDIELKYIKSDIISSYALLETDRWSEILSLLNDADNRMSRLISLSNNSPNMQKIYIELKEYIKSVNDMNLELCYMKYFYLIKDLESEN